MRKTVTYRADDSKIGMRAREIEAVMAMAEPESHPRFSLSIGGKVQSIQIEESENYAKE